MATTMAHLPSTPGAGPSSNPISRAASVSSHASSNQSHSDDEEWLGPFCAELRRNQEARLRDMLQSTEAKYHRLSKSLAERFARGNLEDERLNSDYEQAQRKLDRSFALQKQKVVRFLEEEERNFIEKERGLRKLSLGGQLESDKEKELLREQEELYNLYKSRRSDSANVNNSGATFLPSSTSSRPATWVPPARSMSSNKSNTSTAPSLNQDRRGFAATTQRVSDLTEDLYPRRTPLQSRDVKYASWIDDSSFPSSSKLHDEPEEMPESETDGERDKETDDADEQTGSEEDDSNADDGIYNVCDFMIATERSFSAVPVKTAPLNIARIGTYQHSPRDRSRGTGRTPPSMTMPYSMNTAPVRQQSQKHSLNRTNSDTQHKLWKPSQENMRHPSVNRRPSIADTASGEPEKIREGERSRIENENARVRYAMGSGSGVPGTSVSPPTYGLVSSSIGASSAAAFARSQRSVDVPAQIWRPPENKASVPATSNVHVMASASGTSNTTAPASTLGSSASSPVNILSYRRRNDSETSSGSPVRRPSQHQTQGFAQPGLSPKASLPVSTPGISNSRRSPIPGSESYMSTPSPPISTPISASSARRSPYGPRPPSPPVTPISIGSVDASSGRLSRQPTEVMVPVPPPREIVAKKSSQRARSKSSAVEEAPESEACVHRGSSNLKEHVRSSPSTSALSERMAQERNREADRKHREHDEAFMREGEELHLRDVHLQKREAEPSAQVHAYSSESDEEQESSSEEGQPAPREEQLAAQRTAQEKSARELAETQRSREADFAERHRELETQRQKEADLREELERKLAAKEEELYRHKSEKKESLRLREEHEIAEQIRQLEHLKERESQLEEQQCLLQIEYQRELDEMRKREAKLKQTVEELKRQQRELQEAQRRKEEREREEERRRQAEEAHIAEQRRREDELRAQEDELKQKERAIQQREEALERRRREEELRAKEEALERQRKELAHREEEIARREEEERRRAEERERKDALRLQQDEEDKKRLEVHMMRKVFQQREREVEEQVAKERQMREREERERERREKERRLQRQMEEEKRKQEQEQRANEMERRRKEEEERLPEGDELRQQEELLRFYEQRKLREEARKRDPRGTASSSSFSSSIPNPTSSFSAASGTFHLGRATSSASSIHSNWSGSQRSSASSGSSTMSDFSRTSTTSSATSAWSSSTRPTTASTGSTSSGRTATGETHKPTPGAWRTTNASGSSAGPSPSGAGMGSYTNSSPLSEAEWRRRQEENARKQQEQFRRDSLRDEKERVSQAAAADIASTGKREQLQRAWVEYESGWASLKDQPVLYFQTMPWPVSKRPPTVEDLTTNAIGAFVLSPAHSTGKSNRDRLKEQLLRWHPDRFESKWLPRVIEGDKEIVGSAAGLVVRGLNELMARENNDPFG